MASNFTPPPGFPTLRLDTANIAQWKLRTKAHLSTIRLDGHVASSYLLASTTPVDPDDTMSACVINFLVSTVHHAHANAIVLMTPAAAFDHLSALEAAMSIEDLIDSSPVPMLNNSKTLEEFQSAFLAWFSKITDIEPDSVHASARSKVRFLWSALPKSPTVLGMKQTWTMTHRGANDTTHGSVNEIFAMLKQAEVKPFTSGPSRPSTIRTPARRGNLQHGRTPFGRPGGLINPDPPYSCPICRMDNHRQGESADPRAPCASRSPAHPQRLPPQFPPRRQYPQPPHPPPQFPPRQQYQQPRQPRPDPFNFANIAAAFEAGQRAERPVAPSAPGEAVGEADPYFVNEDASEESPAFLYSHSPASRPPILDSGASAHLLPSAASLRNPMPVNIPITVANGTTIPAVARGNTVLRTGHTSLALPSALHVPGLSTALVSAAQIAKQFSITFYKNHFFISSSSNIPPVHTVVATGSRHNNIYHFDPPSLHALNSATSTPPPRPQRPPSTPARFQIPTAFFPLHNIFNHRHISGLRRLVSTTPALKPAPRKRSSPLSIPCEPCAKAKMTRAPHITNPDPPATRPLHKVTLDTAGPFPPSVRGFRYINPLSDTYSSVSLPLNTKTKGGAAQAVTATLAHWQNVTGHTTLRLQTDGARELSRGHIKAFCDKQGTIITPPPPNQASMNGHAERRVRTHKEDIRAALANAPGGISEQFWCYAAEDASFKAAYIPQPFEKHCPAYLLSPQSYNSKNALRFHIFGQYGYVPNPKRKPTALEHRGLLCRYLSSPNAAIYNIFHPDTKRFSTCRPTEFSPCPPPSKPPSSTTPSPTSPSPPHPSLAAFPAEVRAAVQRPPIHRQPSKAPEKKRVAFVPDNHGLGSRRLLLTPLSTPNPSSLKQALRQPDAAKWASAYDSFLDRQFAIGAWKLVPSSPVAKPCRGTFVFRRKTDGDGNVTSHSVRYAARGDLMTPYVHFDPAHTSAQTPSHTAHRLMYAEAARRNEVLESYDVPGAYARAPADPRFKVRLHQPRRADGTYTKPGHDVLIINAQQGVPDAGNRWQLHRNTIFRKLGWKPLSSEPSAFIIRSPDQRSYARLLATTDDFLLASNNASYLHTLRDEFVDAWDISIQTPVIQHAGLKVVRTPTSITISAQKHISAALDLAGMQACNPSKTPQDPAHDMTARRTDEQQLTEEEHALYRKCVGTLRYVADTVGYEIAYTVSALAIHQNSPCHRHQLALHRLLRYVSGRRDMSLTYTNDCSHPSATFEAFVDSDWAGCVDSRKSRTGIAVQYAGDLICWLSKLQATVSDSSCEAEYIAAAHASKQIQWLRMMAREWLIDLHSSPTPFFLSHKPLEATTLHIDNTGAIAMILADGPTRRSKHIDIKHHSINERARLGIIAPTKIHTSQQKADLFTKCLNRTKFLHNLSLIRAPPDNNSVTPLSGRDDALGARLAPRAAHGNTLLPPPLAAALPRPHRFFPAELRGCVAAQERNNNSAGQMRVQFAS